METGSQFTVRGAEFVGFVEFVGWGSVRGPGAENRGVGFVVRGGDRGSSVACKSCMPTIVNLHDPSDARASADVAAAYGSEHSKRKCHEKESP